MIVLPDYFLEPRGGDGLSFNSWYIVFYYII
jgi:hypothetical protein